MTDTIAAGKELQDQILDNVRKGQEAVVDAVKAWVDAVEPITPPLPATQPFGDKLPRPEELVTNAYDFAQALLTLQREFAQNVLQAVTPVVAKQNAAPTE
jgi:hypothetical protein